MLPTALSLNVAGQPTESQFGEKAAWLAGLQLRSKSGRNEENSNAWADTEERTYNVPLCGPGY